MEDLMVVIEDLKRRKELLELKVQEDKSKLIRYKLRIMQYEQIIKYLTGRFMDRTMNAVSYSNIKSQLNKSDSKTEFKEFIDLKISQLSKESSDTKNLLNYARATRNYYLEKAEFLKAELETLETQLEDLDFEIRSLTSKKKIKVYIKGGKPINDRH